MLMAFGAALGLAVAVLASRGTDADGVVLALRVTARFSFGLFWLAYAGGALFTLFGARFQVLARKARDFGLAFAGAQLVHAGLVAWLYVISPNPPVSQRTLVFFGVALVFTYLLALFSVPRLARLLGRAQWKVLRVTGSEYISFAFLVDFLHQPLRGVHVVSYLPFVVVSVGGTFLRVLARIARAGGGGSERGG